MLCVQKPMHLARDGGPDSSRPFGICKLCQGTGDPGAYVQTAYQNAAVQGTIFRDVFLRQHCRMW